MNVWAVIGGDMIPQVVGSSPTFYVAIHFACCFNVSILFALGFRLNSTQRLDMSKTQKARRAFTQKAGHAALDPPCYLVLVCVG